MVAKLRSCCRIAAPVGGSAAWPTSEEPAKVATPRAAQNGTVQRVSRRSTEDVIGGSHDSTAHDDGGREASPRFAATGPRSSPASHAGGFRQELFGHVECLGDTGDDLCDVLDLPVGVADGVDGGLDPLDGVP